MNKKLSDEDIIALFNEISDDMAFDSDLGGDSDAEDNLPYVQTVKSKFIFVRLLLFTNLQCMYYTYYAIIIYN